MSLQPDEQQNDAVKKTREALQQLHSDEDGRNKEWEDRARVNLEKVPEGTKSNIERDFEAEQTGEKPAGKEDEAADPAY